MNSATHSPPWQGGESKEGSNHLVIPADAGIHDMVFARSKNLWVPWIPTFVGMTGGYWLGMSPPAEAAP